MRKPGRRTITLVAIAVLALGGGAGLWLAGRMPGVPAPTFGAMAATDTTAAGDDATDTKAKDKPKGRKGKDKDKEEPKPVPVELARASARGIEAYYRAASVIEADRLVDLVARVQGRVRQVAVEEGSWVESGKVLAELENDRERIQLEKAELTVADKARLLERSRSMLEQELISQQEFDAVESTWRMAVAERDLAAIALEDTRLRAPFAGMVTDRRIVAGQQVAAGFSAFSLGDFEPLRVRVHLPEDVARKVAAGQRVLVSPEGRELAIEGTVERIAPVVDPATSTVRLTLLLANAGPELRVGGFVKVRITTDQHHDALAVPKLALVEEGALRSVFVAEADTVRKVEIETGLYDETHVEVLSGPRGRRLRGDDGAGWPAHGRPDPRPQRRGCRLRGQDRGCRRLAAGGTADLARAE
ncbi:MAG: efflux RND transporter periplasmic adaptor subunit [bacterium]|nr:efflux RND transporter periplasmic adaptor subunit [bacterium]